MSPTPGRKLAIVMGSYKSLYFLDAQRIAILLNRNLLLLASAKTVIQ